MYSGKALEMEGHCMGPLLQVPETAEGKSNSRQFTEVKVIPLASDTAE